MKCSVCKNCRPHLTKVEKKLFCDQCKPNPIQLDFKAAPRKQENDPVSYDNLDGSSSCINLQKKLKIEDLQEDDETVVSEDHSLDIVTHPVGIDDNAGASNSSGSMPLKATAENNNKSKTVNIKAKKTKCHLCDYSCSMLNTLRRHRKIYHPEFSTGTIRCRICHRPFDGLLNLDKHVDEKHGGFGTKCKFCFEKLKRDQHLQHQRQCEGRHLFSCGTCAKRYVKLESLRKHLDEHAVAEAMKDLSIIKTRTRERLFICVICEEGLVYDEEPYWKHIKEQHDGHYLRCDDCGKTFKESRSWYSHKVYYCRIGPARERFITEDIVCSHCSKPCKNEDVLERHIYNYHSKNISCNECGLTFQTREARKYHKKTVHSEPTFKCSQCPKKIYTKYVLTQHLRVHERGPPVCKICDITFKHHLVLINHNRMMHQPHIDQEKPLNANST